MTWSLPPKRAVPLIIGGTRILWTSFYHHVHSASIVRQKSCACTRTVVQLNVTCVVKVKDSFLPFFILVTLTSNTLAILYYLFFHPPQMKWSTKSCWLIRTARHWLIFDKGIFFPGRCVVKNLHTHTHTHTHTRTQTQTQTQTDTDTRREFGLGRFELWISCQLLYHLVYNPAP